MTAVITKDGSQISAFVAHTEGESVRIVVTSRVSSAGITLNEDEILQLLYILSTKGEKTLPEITPENLEIRFYDEAKFLTHKELYGEGQSSERPIVSSEWGALLDMQKQNLPKKITSIAVSRTMVRFLKEREERFSAATEKALDEKREQIMRETGFEYSKYRHLPRMTQNLIDRIIASEGLDKNL